MSPMMNLVAALLLPIVATALMPRRWLVPWGLFIALAVFVLLIDESRARGGAGAAFGMGLLMWEVFIVSVIFVSRFSWTLFKQDTTVWEQENQGAAAVTWALLAAGSSVALTALWVQGWNFVLDSGLATHAAVFALAIAWFVWTPIVWTSTPSRWIVHTLHPSNVFRFVGTLAIGATLLWSLQVAPKVKAEAELGSGGQPYCVLATGAHGLRTVRSNFDLTGFVMQAGRGAERHAQLASGSAKAPEWRYWSYRKGAFEPEFMGGVLRCDLQPQFAEKLGWLEKVRAEEGDLRFWLGGGQWAIPQEFHGSANGKPETLSFYAEGRDFLALKEGPLRESSKDWYLKQVDVTLCTPKKLHVWQVDRDQYSEVETVGSEYGLVKQRVSRGRGASPSIQLMGYGKAGEATTWVRCDDAGGFCHHAFAREGMVLSFRRPEDELADWKLLQDALWLRLKSFSLVWPDVPGQACDPR